MTVAKTMEITSESPNSFDDAVKRGVGRASETVKNLQGAWVKDHKLILEDGKIASYRVSMRITFVLE